MNFTSNGLNIAATAFAVDFDESCLRFDPTDADAIADLSLPFVTLPDGPLANITFTVNAPTSDQPQATTIAFAGALPASLGTHAGQSAAVTTADGSVLITAVKAADELTETIYLPLVHR